MNWKMMVLGAGVLLIWGLLGASTGIAETITPTIYIVAGLAPAYYLGKIDAVAGYAATFVVIYAWQASLIMPGGA